MSTVYTTWIGDATIMEAEPADSPEHAIDISVERARRDGLMHDPCGDPDCARIHSADEIRVERGEDDTMTIPEIYDLLAEEGVSPTEFWSRAMGGDRAALPREDVLRIIAEMGEEEVAQ